MKLLKSISIYAISNLSKQAVAFMLLPIITHYLSTGQNGDLSTITAIVSLLTPLLILSTHGAVNLEFFRKDQGEENFSSYVSSAMLIPLGTFSLLILGVVLFGSALANWLELAVFWIYLIPVLCFAAFIPQLISVIFQARQQALQHSVYNLSFTFIDLGLSILLIVYLSMNWEGRVLASLTTKVLYSLIGLYFLYRSGLLTKAIKKPYVKDALYFGLPLIPHVIAAGVMDLSDRLFIREMVSREELGIYDIGYKVGSIIMILQASLLLAWLPFLYDKLKNINEQIKTELVSLSYILMLGLLISAGLLSLVAPLLFYFFVGADFSGGLRYVPIIALSYVFFGFYKMFAGYLFYLKKTIILSYVGVFNTLLNIVLNYFLIGKYGAMGAAYATLISYFCFFLIIAIISYRLYPMPWFAFRSIFQYLKIKR